MYDHTSEVGIVQAIYIETTVAWVVTVLESNAVEVANLGGLVKMIGISICNETPHVK